jgi:hypothetical protein
VCFLLDLSDVCSVCSHVIAEHYHSFRIVRTPVEAEGADADVPSSPAAASASAAASADAVASPSSSMRVTHEYLMQCTLCGKGADEQLLNPSGHKSSVPLPASASASAAAASASLPSFSLSSVQLHSLLIDSRPPGQALPTPAGEASAAAASKETDEWAE